MIRVPGLLSSRAYRAGEIIEIAPVRIVFFAGDLESYVFKWAEGRRALAFGIVSLCNHADNPNACVEKVFEDNLIRLVAQADIEDREEITIRYDDDARPPFYSMWRTKT